MPHDPPRNAPPEARPPVQPAWKGEGTLYVLGIDGLTFDVISSMIGRGELPHFARLAESGCWGRLGTISPTNSSLLWTSIATGRHHRDHGVDGFCYYRLLGLHVTRSAVRRAKKIGFKRVLRALEGLGLMVPHLFDGRHVRTKTFWDIVSEGGQRVGVVNWWHTWPADPVNGFVVSDKLHYWRAAAAGKNTPPAHNLTMPEGLLDDLRELIVSPGSVSREELRTFVNLPERELDEFAGAEWRHHELRGELRFLISADRTYFQVLDRCLATFPDLQLAAAYFRGPDIAQHCAFHYMEGSADSAASAEDRRHYGNVVPQAYRLADEVVGDVMRRLRPEDSLLVISDHGFAFQPKRGTYGHARGEPPGVIYAFGRDFAHGREVRNATIYDVAPTILRVCGFPPAEDMEGRSIEDALAPEFVRAHPPLQPVPSYGLRTRRHDIPPATGQVDDVVKEHLRALGYMD